MSKRLLLLSNSTNVGEPYLGWCKSTINDFVGLEKQSIVFVPYAGVTITYTEYTAKVNDALANHGISVLNLDDFEDKQAAISNASAIFVGGGNTFHLLKKIQEYKLTELIQQVVNNGKPYVGWSAGSNVACPTICTTNDMPIVEPSSFNALDLVPFQINPHFTKEVIEGHGGESRLTRLQEYLQVNNTERVVCLPEASYLKFENGELYYHGQKPMMSLLPTGATEIFDGIVSDQLLK